MKKLIERLLLFFVGLPLILASVFLLPYNSYLVLHIELLIFCALGIIEMRFILSQKMPVFSLPVMLIIGLLVPVAALLYAVFGLPFRLITFSIAISSVFVLFLEFLYSFSGNFEKSLGRIASSFITIIYPGYLAMYLSIMTVWEGAGSALTIFLLMVFGCDSLAWFFGMLLGKHNRGFLPASPNKSIAGFIGGYIGAIAAGIAGFYVFPAVFSGPIWKVITLALLTATASIVGDIIESIFKRSAGVKDSGNLIPGRGGVLDSIDSILLSAPVFYIVTDFLFGL